MHFIDSGIEIQCLIFRMQCSVQKLLNLYPITSKFANASYEKDK